MRNTYCTVDLGAIQNNLGVIRSACNPATKVCAVIKANAYGHGLVPVAKRLQECGTDYLAVAIANEGVRLREAGVTIPILVMAGVDNDDIEICINHDLTVTASSLDKLTRIATIAEVQKKIPTVHLKIDTGMGRIGVHWERFHALIDYAKQLVNESKIMCEGIYTHFSDSLDSDYTRIQFDRFLNVIDYAKSIGLTIPIRHTCSSRSIFMYPQFHLDMVRPGIALYGIEPETEFDILPASMRPSLQWKTKVVYFKVVSNDEPVGYGRSWKPGDDYARIISIPVGYADGFPRRLSNLGEVIVRGERYGVAGRVCMDQVMVSLGNSGTAYLDDEVILIGTDGDCAITAKMIAEKIGTAPHEITTCISDRVPRIYIQ
ncbi:MAG: alr [Patescibacteria group bacterium]|nr:alr [Patescibacteria group bacterium]